MDGKDGGEDDDVYEACASDWGGDGATTRLGSMTKRPPLAVMRVAAIGGLKMQSLNEADDDMPTTQSLPSVNYVFVPQLCRRLADFDHSGVLSMETARPLLDLLPPLFHPPHLNLVSCVYRRYESERQQAPAEDPDIDWRLLRTGYGANNIWLLVVSVGGVGRPVCGLNAAASQLLAGEEAFTTAVLVRASLLRGPVAVAPARRRLEAYGPTSLLLMFFARAAAAS